MAEQFLFSVRLLKFPSYIEMFYILTCILGFLICMKLNLFTCLLALLWHFRTLHLSRGFCFMRNLLHGAVANNVITLPVVMFATCFELEDSLPYLRQHPLYSILSQVHPFHTLTLSFYNIHFIVALSFISRFLKWSLAFKFSD
jgi:hypothetical protein